MDKIKEFRVVEVVASNGDTHYNIERGSVAGAWMLIAYYLDKKKALKECDKMIAHVEKKQDRTIIYSKILEK